LCFIFKPAKRPRMDHAVTVALEVCAIGMAWLGIATASAFFLLESVSLHFQILALLSLRSKPLKSVHRGHTGVLLLQRARRAWTARALVYIASVASLQTA
jgi:hypothetical protein